MCHVGTYTKPLQSSRDRLNNEFRRAWRDLTRSMAFSSNNARETLSKPHFPRHIRTARNRLTDMVRTKHFDVFQTDNSLAVKIKVDLPGPLALCKLMRVVSCALSNS